MRYRFLRTTARIIILSFDFIGRFRWQMDEFSLTDERFKMEVYVLINSLTDIFQILKEIKLVTKICYTIMISMCIST